MAQPPLSSLQNLRNSMEPESKPNGYRRPWITPSFKPLDLTTARASGCRSANDGGSC
jgi:hypothetical protein